MLRRAALLAAAILVLMPPAQAASHAPDYSVTIPYLTDLRPDGNLTVVSGAMAATLPAASGAAGFFNTTGAAITGLTRVCWTSADADCADAPTGSLRIDVVRGAFAVRLPDPVRLDAGADHGMALFYDFAQQRDLNSLGLGRSLAMPAVGGSVSYGAIPAIPLRTPDGDGDGVAVALDAGTRIEVRRAGALVHAIEGKQDPLLFQGAPALAPFGAALMVLPFGEGARLQVRAAELRDAQAGLDLARLAALISSLEGARAGGDSGNAVSDVDLGPVESVAPRLLNGAVVTLGTDVDNLLASILSNFARIDTLTVTPTERGVHMEGDGPLVLQDGHVVRSHPLVGFGLLQMPWWSWLLWAAGIAAFVMVLVRRPAKENERWSRLNWVGWVALAVTAPLVFWLWDREVARVWGVSILTPGLDAEALRFAAVVELLPALAILFAVVSPLRLVLRHGLRLAGQGRFMRLAAPAALLLGYLAGVGLMHAYIDLFLHAAVAAAPAA
jgi:hypothetical protein